MLLIHVFRTVIINKGEDVLLSYETKYSYTFSCSFEFSQFPFDVQLCHMEFKLLQNAGSKCQPHWALNDNKVISSKESIAKYEVDSLRYEAPSEDDVDRSTLTIKIFFTRRYYSYLLTTFFPCVILYILGVLTMTSFKLDNFSDRITVTLSLLIVVASLFSQVVASLPTSPTPKCVEIFFFFIIVQLAIIFVLHTIVAYFIYSGRTERTAEAKEIKNNSNIKLSNWMGNDDDIEVSKFIPKKAIAANIVGCIISSILSVIFTVVIIHFVLSENLRITDSYLSGTTISEQS